MKVQERLKWVVPSALDGVESIELFSWFSFYAEDERVSATS